MKKTKKGFTLVELIVVLAILAIITVIAVPTAFGSIEKARVGADTASIDAFNSAIRMQTALIQAEVTPTSGNTVKDAFEVAAIADVSPQSKDLYVKFNKTTAEKPASFEIVKKDAGGTQILNDSTFKDQLLKLIPKGDEVLVLTK